MTAERLTPTADGCCPSCGGDYFQVVETGYSHWWAFGDLTWNQDTQRWEARPAGTSFDWSDGGAGDDRVECRNCLAEIDVPMEWG